MAYRKPRVIVVYGLPDKETSVRTWGSNKITIKELRESFNIPEDKMILLKTPRGAKYFKHSGTIDLSKYGATINVQPDVTQGSFWKRKASSVIANQDLKSIDYRQNVKARYLITQLLAYGEEKYRREKVTIQVTSDLKYVYIPHFPLPPIWKQRRVPILIYIPKSYPEVPPIGFYIPCGTCLKNGNKHPHQYCRTYLGQPDLHEKGWDWFCLHLKNSSDWNPKDDPLKPDNFWSYMNIVRLGLSYYELGDFQ